MKTGFDCLQTCFMIGIFPFFHPKDDAQRHNRRQQDGLSDCELKHGQPILGHSKSMSRLTVLDNRQNQLMPLGQVLMRAVVSSVHDGPAFYDLGNFPDGFAVSKNYG